MLTPPDKNLSGKKFTLWMIVILMIAVMQFVLSMTGHQKIDTDIRMVAVAAEAAKTCPTPLALYNPMLSP